MTKFVNMDFDSSENKLWIDSINNYPTNLSSSRSWYDTEAEAYTYYYQII